MADDWDCNVYVNTVCKPPELDRRRAKVRAGEATSPPVTTETS
jgi:hypothetical protein